MLTEFKLNLIAKRAKQDKPFKFSNLMHLLNEWSLKSSFYMLKKTKAPGDPLICMTLLVIAHPAERGIRKAGIDENFINPYDCRI